MSEEVGRAFSKILDSGHMGGLVLQVDDCKATYRELKDRGVEFDSEPVLESYGLQAILKDDSGNRIAVLSAV